MAEERKNQEIGYVKPVEIEEEVQSSYLDYAMSVIVSRALPDVRDGLKPVHRRILYAMNQMGLHAGAKFRKSATVVGEVLGKYHPHGDVPVYDALVGMAQPFKMRYPLILGQGNFGSLDGDPPAAMRYTEAKMAPIAEEMLADIEKETVDFKDNYDGTRKEPVVLPAKIPNLILNGTLGIAVGMATNIPPHNLNEVVDALLYLADNPEASTEDLLQFIKGPDFPTGGIILNGEELKEVYATGKGRILIRAVAEIEETEKGFRIVISELPYQLNKAVLVERIADLIKEKKIEGVADLRDESSGEGVRIVLDLKKNSFPKKILNQLYKYTPMQTVFHANILALTKNLEPKVMNLKMLLEYFLEHRKEVVRRRCEFELREARLRLHILEGLKIALDHLDEVISLIKKSPDRNTAKEQLIKKFELSEIQANAILDMRLHQLAALERQKIEDEYQEKKKLIEFLESVLSDPKKLLGLIKDELQEVKEKYGDERRTKIVKNGNTQFSEEDLIPNETVVITISTNNYIKRIPLSAYKAQKRGGKGVLGMTTAEEESIKQLLVAQNHDRLFFFTDTGKMFSCPVYELPKGTRTSKGNALVNFLNLSSGEDITSVVAIPKNSPIHYLLMVTRRGIVKKTPLAAFSNIRKSGLFAIKIKNDDRLCWVRGTSGEDEVVIVTKKGMAIKFSEKDIRGMGRSASGVVGIKLKPGDEVIGADVLEKETDAKKKGKKEKKDILVISEFGYGKKTAVENYHLQKRGGIGLKTFKITSKTGDLVAMKVLNQAVKQLILISEKGQVIRISTGSIPRLSRATQGVRLMRLNPEDRVVSFGCVFENEEDFSEEGFAELQEESKNLHESLENLEKPEKENEEKEDNKKEEKKKGKTEKEGLKKEEKIKVEKTESKTAEKKKDNLSAAGKIQKTSQKEIKDKKSSQKKNSSKKDTQNSAVSEIDKIAALKFKKTDKENPFKNKNLWGG